MNRREFIKTASTLGALSVASPYILPSGRLFAQTGSRKANHVVFCLFAGGVRNIESVDKAEGNLMHNTFVGNEAISPDIAHAIPDYGSFTPLQLFGTTYKQFSYKEGPTGHFNGHAAAITGRYTSTKLSLRHPPEYPTIFELYRKHSSGENNGLNAWWLPHGNYLYPILAYSQYPGYGPDYGANNMAATQLIQPKMDAYLGEMLQFHPEELGSIEEARNFLDQNFNKGQNGPDTGIKNTVEESKRIQDFIQFLYEAQLAGYHTDPWSVGEMNNDMRNIFYAQEVLKEFAPELLVVNMIGVDKCHTNFTEYCANLRRADLAIALLWRTIQSIPEMQDDTVLIIAPEVGRNTSPNHLLDENRREAFDHTDDTARDIFCVMVGPEGVVNQNKMISEQVGESIDIVPTIANILGFDHEIRGLLPGRVLREAFV